MNKITLSDRDIFALHKVLNKALDEAEFCFIGVQHARLVTLMINQYVDKKINDLGNEYIDNLRINL